LTTTVATWAPVEQPTRQHIWPPPSIEPGIFDGLFTYQRHLLLDGWDI
jgi:hypothetical protein